MASSLSHLTLSQVIQPFVSLSYPVPTPKNPDSFPDAPYYATGLKDLLFIVGLIAVMAVLRDVTRLYVFDPIARWKLTGDFHAQQRRANGRINGHANGHAKPSKKQLQKINHSVIRFSEQGWPLVYYTVQWCYGVYVNMSLPNGLFSHASLWAGYPHFPLAGPVKFYYLTQTAFYTHQILVLQAEEHRKDHVQMMSHHFITVFLMGLSFFFNFTRVGSLIMVLMDTCDIFLPLGKMSKYLNFPHQVSDWIFGLFMFSWLITRHGFFNLVIYSTVFENVIYIPHEWDPANGKFFSREYYWVFAGSLIILQFIQIAWFATIVKIAWNVLVHGAEADDVRSDDEGDADTEDEKKDQ